MAARWHAIHQFRLEPRRHTARGTSPRRARQAARPRPGPRTRRGAAAPKRRPFAPRPAPLAEGPRRPGRIRRRAGPGACRCPAGPTSGRCRSRTAWTCSRPASTPTSACAFSADDLDDVVRASEDIAAVLQGSCAGPSDVVADPVRGKGYLEVRPDRDKAADLGVSVGAINEVVETALGGKVVTTTVEGRERHPVRVRFPRAWRLDEESAQRLPVPRSDGRPPIPLAAVADVTHRRGPGRDPGRERAAAELRTPQRPRPEHGRIRRRRPPGGRHERATPARRPRRVDRPVRARGPHSRRRSCSSSRSPSS